MSATWCTLQRLRPAGRTVLVNEGALLLGPCPHRLLPSCGLLLLLGALAGCESTALYLDNPNDISVVFDPEFLGPEVYQGTVQATFLGVEDSAEGSPGARYVGQVDLGDGLELTGWEFESEYSLELQLFRYADAPQGVRSLSFEIHNRFGTFLASGEFTLL